jgi:uncharacterized LabA/DUF88 family protein
MEEKPEVVYAFIDSQNINLGVERDLKDREGKLLYEGWKLDFRKLRLYLKNKYGVSQAYLFIGNVPGNEKLYSSLQEMGYTVVLKPTMPFRENGVASQKGNVDAELVLYSAKLTFDRYDKAIIMSGDGDFLCLVEFLEAEDKLLRILPPNFRYSRLLKKYAPRISIIGDLKDKLEKK